MERNVGLEGGQVGQDLISCVERLSILRALGSEVGGREWRERGVPCHNLPTAPLAPQWISTLQAKQFR